MKTAIARRTTILLLPNLIALGLLFGEPFIPNAANSAAQVRVYVNYVPPDWAPPYDNESSIRYYYLPDYDMYYDVWERQYFYLDGGQWVASYELPPMWAGISLATAFIVLIDRDVDRPWFQHDYYVRNYPRHGYDHYRDIVVRNRIITNMRPGHELVPRAYNERNRRVTFMQHPIPGAPQDNREIGRTPGEQRGGQTPPPRPPAVNGGYHQQVHEVPMKSIAPSMPPESRKFNYGGGMNREKRPTPSPAARPAAAAQQPRTAPAQRQAPAQRTAPAQAPRPAPSQSQGNQQGKGRTQ